MKRIMLLSLIFAFVPQLTFADYDRGLEAFNQGDYATALKEFSAAAEQGHAGAQVNLGNMYANGLGVPKKGAEALRLYESAAEQGNESLYYFIKSASEQGSDSAQNTMGIMFKEGRGIQRNYSEAQRWFMRSAEQGNMYAQLNIGNMYKEGIGVQKNIILAYKWINLAASQNNEEAQRILKIIEGKMTREQILDGLVLSSKFIPQKEKEKFITPNVFPSYSKRFLDYIFYFKDEEGVLQFFSVSKIESSLADLGPGFSSERDRRFQEAAERITQPREQFRPQALKSDELKLVSTSTGFFVSNQGHVLTNQHVVESCEQVRVNVPTGTSNASILAVNQNDDLALLFAEVKPAAVASFRRTAAEVGEDVSVAGYPLHGLLGGLNIASGSVSSATGLRGDARYLQISAPVQPGNSGGPLLDSAGTVVGVVVAKLDAIAVAQAIGDIPQNVNFAIKSAVARSFLSIHGIAYQESTPRRDKSRVAIAAEAQQHTVLVECWK